MATIQAAESQLLQILEALRMLPAEQVREVRDFVLFLRERYGGTPFADFDDAWSEQDICDLTAATLTHAERSLGAEESTSG